MTALRKQFPQGNFEEREQPNSKTRQISNTKERSEGSKEKSKDPVSNEKASGLLAECSKRWHFHYKRLIKPKKVRRFLSVFIIIPTSSEGPPPLIVKVCKRSRFPRTRKATKSDKRSSKRFFSNDFKKPCRFWKRKLRFGIRDFSIGNFYEPSCGLSYQEFDLCGKRSKPRQFAKQPADHPIASPDVTSGSYPATEIDEFLCELVNDCDDFIVRDLNSQCGFVVIYPDRNMAMEGRGEDVSTLSTGTQLGDGILTESAYSVAVEFAKQHGYGLVEFVEDVPSKKRIKYGIRKKTERKSFSRVLSTREESRSVVKKDVKSPRQLSQVKKCPSKLDMQREGVLTHISFLDRIEKNLSSVGNIAEQISDINISDYDHILPRQLDKRNLDSLKKDDQVSVESPGKAEDEIIKSAPLDEYMEYLSKICRNIYHNKREDATKQVQEKVKGNTDGVVGDSKEKAHSLIFKSFSGTFPDNQDQLGELISFHGERNATTKRRDNNNNVSEDSKIWSEANSHLSAQAEELIQSKSEPDGASGKLPRLNAKTTKLYRFCNSLSSCIYREQQRLHSMTGANQAGMSGVLKSEVEVVRYSSLGHPDDADEEGKERIESQPQPADQSQKAPQISSSSSGAQSPSKFCRHAVSANDHCRQAVSGLKAMKHEHGVSSCMDLSSSQKTKTNETGRGKEMLTMQRSPSRENTRKSAAGNAMEQELVPSPAHSSYRAQGDVLVSPSRRVDQRLFEQGDVRIAFKE